MKCSAQEILIIIFKRVVWLWDFKKKKKKLLQIAVGWNFFGT